MPAGNKVQVVLKSAQKIPKDFAVIMRRVLKHLGCPIDPNSSTLIKNYDSVSSITLQNFRLLNDDDMELPGTILSENSV